MTRETPGLTTYGWDVVVASRTSVINAGLTPVGQSFDESVAHPTGAVQAVGALAGCAFAPGGSASLVHLTFACPNLTLSNSQKTFKFADGHFLVQARLHLAAHADGSAQQLKVAAGRGAVTVLAASFPQADFATLETYAKAAVQQWFDQQSDLPYVFATFAPLAGGGSALQPVSATYAYADAAKGDGVLGLLGVVAGGADPAGLLAEVDPRLVSEEPVVAVINVSVLQQLVGGITGSIGLTGSTAAIHLTSPMTLPWYQTGQTT